MMSTNEQVSDLVVAETVRSELAKDFPDQSLRQLVKQGTSLTYVPIAEVINRMNRVVGINNWSTEIVKVERDALNPEWVIAWVRVNIRIGDRVVSKDGVGGQQVKMKRDKSGPVDLGDEFKGAVSDATKKAIQQLGVALYLARDEQSTALDETEYASESDKKRDEMWKMFEEHASTMTDDEKVQVKTWWQETYKNADGDARPMKRTEVSLEEAEALLVHVAAVRLDAQLVEIANSEEGE